VGTDFPESCTRLLSDNSVDLFGVKRVQNAFTTSFVLKYADEKRQLQLKNLAPPILLEDLPSEFEAKSIHIAPIAGEVSPEIIDELRKRADTLSLDPQGFLRRFDKCGKVTLKKWADKRVLEQVDVYKSSLQEIRAATGLRSLRGSMRKIQDFGVKVVIVTMGVKGAAVFFDKTFYEIPAIQPQKLIDSTGAGDVFAGAFLAEYICKEDPVWCACVGSATASFKLETFGPLFGGEKEAIYKRAEHLYEKVTHNRL
jgi:sugar/nucleoside kinase (ribokinase family)